MAFNSQGSAEMLRAFAERERRQIERMPRDLQRWNRLQGVTANSLGRFFHPYRRLITRIISAAKDARDFADLLDRFRRGAEMAPACGEYVFADPARPSDILLANGWLVCRIERRIAHVDPWEWESSEATLSFENGLYYADERHLPASRRGLLKNATPWKKMMMRTYSFSALLLRRPRFAETELRFWDGAGWIRVTGLPTIDLRTA